jgi:hypothetical protein
MRQGQIETKTETIEPRWSGLAVVAATGPSLTPELAEQCRGHNCIAVNDAYRLLPFAPVMYACDASWWDYHKGCPDFAGEKWSSHQRGANDKEQTAKKYGLKLISGLKADGFSFQPDRIHYGSNSGFQAINLALLFGATRIALVGFDMHPVNGKQHFFGLHPKPLQRGMGYGRWIAWFKEAAATMPPWIEIINCTPGSALTAFPFGNLSEVLNGAQTGNRANV